MLLDITPPVGTPWWGWLVAVAIPGIASVIIAALSRRDMREVREQVKNTHSTNLRVDLDDTRTLAADASADAKLAAESAHRVERIAKDLSVSMRAVEHSLDRHVTLQTAATEEIRTDLKAHVGEVPDVIESALRQSDRSTARQIREHEQRWHQTSDHPADTTGGTHDR